MEKVSVQEDGCWLWLGARHGRGDYGSFRPTSTTKATAHRFSYELHVGPIAAGLTLDHLCRVPACVNPAHLEPVTLAENIRRGGNAIKTHCPQGHPYDAENTIHYRGGRYCRACKPAKDLRYRARKAVSGRD